MLPEIKLHNGTPTLFLDGKPSHIGVLRSNTHNRHYAAEGIHIHTYDPGFYWRETDDPRPASERPDPFDFSRIEPHFRSVLAVDPNAHFYVRLHLDMQEWWQKLHPEECCLASDGERMEQCYASTFWRQEFATLLRAYIAHVESIGLGDRVILYQPGGGGTTEWVNNVAMAGRCGDYSEPMHRHFRQWLRQRYHDDVSALRAAWRDPYVTFENAAVPPHAEQMRIKPPTLRDPTKEQRAIDFFRCWADLCADLAIEACRIVKEATKGKALAGTFFGKLFELAWNSAYFGGGTESQYSTYQRSGHLALKRVLESPHVDFITSSYNYFFRTIGGEGAPMLITESVRLHGKFHMFDDDTRTHALLRMGNDYGRAQNLSESVAILRRNFAQTLTRGLLSTWNDGGIEYSEFNPEVEPGFGPLLHQFVELGKFAMNLDRTPQAEIAVLLDEDGFFYETVLNDLDIPLIVQQRLLGLPRMGAPYDIYLLQDLVEGKLPPYKLYMFLNPFWLDKPRREALKRELRKDGRTSLWIYAPGYIQDDCSLANMSDLTSFGFGMGKHPWGPLMHLTDLEHPITRGLSQDLVWGTNNRLSPVFHLEDSGATILGQVVYSEGRCKPGFGVRELPDWKSIYIAAPNVPAPILRGIARYAGVHLYNEAGDVLYATPQLLGVHTIKGGARAFRLPKKAEVVHDLFERKDIARDVAEFTVSLPPASTSLYYTGQAALLATLK